MAWFPLNQAERDQPSQFRLERVRANEGKRPTCTELSQMNELIFCGEALEQKAHNALDVSALPLLLVLNRANLVCNSGIYETPTADHRADIFPSPPNRRLPIAHRPGAIIGRGGQTRQIA